MQLNQAKFIWLANNVKATSLEQDSSPVVTMHLRPQIDITHNYKLRDRVEIVFKDDGKKFFVPDHNMLEEICRYHMLNKDCVQIIRRYAEENLEPVN